jgi:aspartate kinase
VLSSFQEDAGTDIISENDLMDSWHVSGITHKNDEARITLGTVRNETEVIGDIFDILDHANVTLDMIVQNISLDDQTDLTFTIPKGEIPRVMDALHEKQGNSFQDLIIDPNVAKITVVGVGLQRRLGIASLMLKTLAQMGIATQVISCSSLKVSVLVNESIAEEALRQLHTAYGLDKEVAF